MSGFWIGFYVAVIIVAIVVVVALVFRRVRVVGPGVRALTKHSQAQSNNRKNHMAVIMEYLQENDSITNDIVQEITGVSDATATRYLDQLEASLAVTARGEGRGVRYYKK